MSNKQFCLHVTWCGLLVLLFFNRVAWYQEISAAEQSGRITLRDASNRVMGYIGGGSGKVAVKDKNNKLIGWVDSNNTWSKSNSRIARSRLPGLLFCDKYNR